MVDGLDSWYVTAPDDVEVVNVVVEDSGHQPAQVSDAQEWVDYHDLTWVTVADHEGSWVEVWGDLNSESKPQQSYTVISSDGVITWSDRHANTGNATAQDIIAAVEATE